MNALSAIEVAPGRYAFRLHRSMRWQPGRRDQIVDVSGKRLEAPFMPMWWSPDRQYAVAHRDRTAYHSTRALLASFDSLGPAMGGLGVVKSDGWSVITADLETGSEIAV